MRSAPPRTTSSFGVETKTFPKTEKSSSSKRNRKRRKARRVTFSRRGSRSRSRSRSQSRYTHLPAPRARHQRRARARRFPDAPDRGEHQPEATGTADAAAALLTNGHGESASLGGLPHSWPHWEGCLTHGLTGRAATWWCGATCAARLAREQPRSDSLSLSLSLSLSHAREGDGGAGSMAVSA